MTRFAPLLLALCCLLPAVTASAEDFPALLDTLELNDGDCVVFLGDSITHQCLYTQYVEDFFYTRFPNKRIRFHNAGVGGARAWDALQRFDRDVASYKPKYVTILLGMNDGTYQPFNQEVFDTYTKDMTEVVEKIKAAGATPILMTPTMYDARPARMKGKNEPAQEFYNSVLAYYGTWLRDVAQRNGHGFVDMWSPLNNLTIDRRETEPKFTLIEDSVHPGPSGQLVMAYAILDDLDLRSPVSVIRIDAASEKAKGRGTGGELTDLNKTDSGLSFTWTAESLPFVVPEAAQPGAKLLRLGHRASREALVVFGLPSGNYQLLIDGEPIGEFASAKLADGIELQDNAKTPQYQQALQVAGLNKQRNEGPVRSLRNEWGVFQGYARKKREVAENPENAKATEELKQLEERIAGMEERVAKHEADAKAIEDEIFQVNQPKPHRYEVRPAGRNANRRAARQTGRAVSGVVTLKGQPLEGATVTLVGDDGVAASGVTDETGRYHLKAADGEAVPVGEYTATASGAGVPKQFADPDKSSLRVEVRDGVNQIDFELGGRPGT